MTMSGDASIQAYRTAGAAFAFPPATDMDVLGVSSTVKKNASERCVTSGAVPALRNVVSRYGRRFS